MAIKPVGTGYTQEGTATVVQPNGVLSASTSSSGNGLRNITVSSSDPSGGSDGDVWVKYIP